MRNCSYCGKELEDNIDYCPSCGEKVDKLKCPHCNEDISEDETYCHHCGTRLSKEKLSPEEKEKLKKDNKKGFGLSLIYLLTKIFALLIPLALIAVVVIFPIVQKEENSIKFLDVINMDLINSIKSSFGEGGSQREGFIAIFKALNILIYSIILIVMAIISLVKSIISLTSFYHKKPNYKYAILSYSAYIGLIFSFIMWEANDNLLNAIPMVQLIALATPIVIYLVFYILRVLFDKEDRKVRTIIGSSLKIVSYLVSIVGIYFLFSGVILKNGENSLLNEMYLYQMNTVVVANENANILDFILAPALLFEITLCVARIPSISSHSLVHPLVKNDKTIKSIVKTIFLYADIIGLTIGCIFIFKLSDTYSFSINTLILPIACMLGSLILDIVGHILANKPKVKVLYV